MPYRDNTDAAAQAADDHWSEYGDMSPSQAWSYEQEQMRATITVEIFGSDTCKFCEKAKELVIKEGYKLSYKNIDQDEEAFDHLVSRIKTWKTVPQIFIGANHIGGYDDLVKHWGTE